MTLLDLRPLQRPTLDPWFEVVIGGGEESHDGDTQETPRTTPTSLLAETSLKKTPPEGLPLDSTSGSMHSWTLELATLERWLVLARLLKPLGFRNSYMSLDPSG